MIAKLKLANQRQLNLGKSFIRILLLFLYEILAHGPVQIACRKRHKGHKEISRAFCAFL
jgi:hypothetical protein